jgi:hypothetical protein
MQMHSAVHHFSQVKTIKAFIDIFDKKMCIFSAKQNMLKSPNGIADPFGRIDKHLPAPKSINFQPITKRGYEAIETPIIEI